MTLYEITDEIELLSQLDDKTDEEAVEILGILESNYVDKLQSYGKVMQNIKSDMEAVNTEIQRLSDKKDRLEKNLDRLKNGIKESMTRLNINKVKTPLFSFNISNSAPKIEIAQNAKIPPEFLVYKEPTVNKTELKKAVQNGLIIDGVSLIQGKRLLIK